MVVNKLSLKAMHSLGTSPDTIQQPSVQSTFSLHVYSYMYSSYLMLFLFFYFYLYFYYFVVYTSTIGINF